MEYEVKKIYYNSTRRHCSLYPLFSGILKNSLERCAARQRDSRADHLCIRVIVLTLFFKYILVSLREMLV